MRKVLAGAAAALVLSSAMAPAGGMPEVVMEPEVVRENTSSSQAGILVPILFLVLIAAAVSSGSDAPAGPSM